MALVKGLLSFGIIAVLPNLVESFQNNPCRFDVTLSLNRRSFLDSIFTSAFVAQLLPERAFCIGEGEQRMVFKQKPTAPIGALVPAIQQRLLVEAAVDLVGKGDTGKLKSFLSRLDEENRIPDSKLLESYDTALVLRGDLTRATMNLYQLNLNYNNLLANPNEAFTVTDQAWKKSYIRANDGLPDLKRIIGADLDMRQLLRNQVQLKLDDASAELYADDCDVEELDHLLREAANNFDLWLDRVRTGDVQDALKVALKGETITIYEPYNAGFLPGRT